MIINNEQELWTKIEYFPLDDPNSALSFTPRLAKENNWDLDFATRVTDEYKRFIFLCMISPTPVSPSEEVDQAWHMHMTYTESYWTDLCARVLGKPLHHHPTRGGPEEREKFFALYENTLALYREKFKEDPPSDIWPPAEKRFSHTEFVRVDKSTHWLIPKPRIKPDYSKAIGMNVFAGLISLGTGNWVFSIIAIIASLAVIFPTHASASNGSGSGCTSFWGGGDGSGGCGGDSGGGCGSGCGGCGGGCS